MDEKHKDWVLSLTETKIEIVSMIDHHTELFRRLMRRVSKLENRIKELENHIKELEG